MAGERLRKDVTNVAMLAPARVAPQLHPEANIQKVSPAVRQAEARHAQEIRQVAVQRAKSETTLVSQGHTVANLAAKAPPGQPAQAGVGRPAREGSRHRHQRELIPCVPARAAAGHEHEQDDGDQPPVEHAPEP